MQLSRVVTELGDLVPACAVSAVIVLWTWTRLDRTLALSFAVCFGGVVTVTTLLKLVTRYAFPQPADAGLLSLSSGAPSGHAALATVVYGCAAVIFARCERGAGAVAGTAACVAALAAVALTRVTLHTHTIADVAAGGALSAVFVGLFAEISRRRDPPRDERAMVLLAIIAAVAVIALASGVRLSSDMIL